MKMTTCIITGLLCVAAGVGLAGPRTLSLNDCVTYGLEHSLSLRNAAIDEAVMQARTESVDGAYDPRLGGQITYTDSQVRDGTTFFLDDRQVTAAELSMGKAFASGTRVELRADHSHIEAGGDVSAFLSEPYSSSASLSVSQSILRNAFGEMDRARRAGADAGERAARLAYQRQAELSAGGIAGGYWDLYRAQKNFETGNDSLARAQKLLETNRDRAADGLLEETDLLASDALIATRRVEVLALSNAVANAADALKNMIQLPREEWEDVQIELPDDVVMDAPVIDPQADTQAACRAAFSMRRDLAALSELVLQADAGRKMRESEYRHDLQVFGELGRGSSDADFDGSLAFDDNAWTLGVLMDIGWGRTAERSAMQEARLIHEKAVNNQKAMEAAIGLECALTARNLQNGWQGVVETRRARDLQVRKLTLEQEKYEQGRSAINWIVQYEDDYAMARMTHNVALASYQKAIVHYRLARGDAPVPGAETDR